MKSSRASLRFAAPKAAPLPPLAERGRMLFVRDVIALLNNASGGTLQRSEWWVRNRFAPEYKHKLGRDPYWWETQAMEWLDRDGAA